MKVFVLGIDVNRASCDPTLYPELDPYQRAQSQHLDETARKIADFTADARDYAPFAWGMQLSDTRPGHERDYTLQEAAFHRVIPFPMEDDFLPKTQMSPYPEHKPYFEAKKQAGEDTAVLLGFYAPECIYWAMNDLVKNGFRVVLPTDLVAAAHPSHPMEHFEEFMFDAGQGKIIFTNADRTLSMLQTPEDRRVLPVPLYDYNDLHQMYFGPGS
ncbi:MAG: isochorismatase family protein [Alphaproteobacteria bacterium]|nr:isochorismatase family protein [Alphaproteobacteria bacterium]MBP7757675.1 isochorismatase family protein [Alphaproteobacteria bacterium]MBP7761125.1 isochorismatase family protein [Alphaproteobacteria bacterium]MBP7904772.1 isochorismatase family protein [Alphaproteobacteria bacterium]